MNTKAKCPRCKVIRVFLTFEVDGLNVKKCEECMSELPIKKSLKDNQKRTLSNLKARLYRAKKRSKTIIGEFHIVRKQMKNLKGKPAKVLPITFCTNTEAENYMKKVLGSPASRYYKIVNLR